MSTIVVNYRRHTTYLNRYNYHVSYEIHYKLISERGGRQEITVERVEGEPINEPDGRIDCICSISDITVLSWLII